MVIPKILFLKLSTFFLTTNSSMSARSKEIFLKCLYVFLLLVKTLFLLSKRLSRVFEELNLDVFIYFNTFKVKSYFSLKDVTEFGLKSGVIYKFSCQVDPSISYIGKTKRHLCRRIQEHSKGPSAIFSHVSTCNNCNFNKSFSILDSASSDFCLKIKEAIYIKSCEPVLNTQLFRSGSQFVLKVFY